jgi:hypothetical protein
MRSFKSIVLVSLLASAAACDLEIGDLNNPGLDSLEETPTASGISAACTGLLIGNRGGVSAGNGYVSQLGILGRESYNFDQADPRYIGELLTGELNPGSPFGGAFWAGPYANIRLANIILNGVDKVADFTDGDKAAIRGFAQTSMAIDLLTVINTRDTNGGVIDTDRGIDDPGPMVDKAAVMAEIGNLLDTAADDLAAGSDAFPFALSSGYTGFDTPATYLPFNRALRARVAAYNEDYGTALTALAASFLDTAGSMELGVYHVYSTGNGDATNGLINPNIYAHPGLATDVEAGDARYAAKVAETETPGSAQGLTSNLVFTIYGSPSAPVPVIRNEELILLRAEANWFEGNTSEAADDLNTVRTESGGLTAIGTPGDDAAFVDALLYEREFSLLFEGGHRWIDFRRFGREIPVDNGDQTRNVRYPIPQDECNARPGEPACEGGSF